MKRRLKGRELVFAMKGLENKKQEMEWLLYQLDYHSLMLDKGLLMNHKKNIRDFKQQKNEFERDLVIVKNVVNILQEQIRSGVEEKKRDEIKQEDIQ